MPHSGHHVFYQYTVEADGRVQFLSLLPAACAMLQIDEADLQTNAERLFARIHPEDRQFVKDSFLQSARSGRARHVRYRVMLPEGGCCWVEAKATAQHAERGQVIWNGQLCAVVETGHDRAYSVDRGRQSYSQYEADHALFMTWVRNGEGQLAWVSPDFQAFLGLGLSETLDVSLLQHIHPKDVGVYLQYWRQPLKYAYQIEYRLRRHDGRWRWVMEQGNPRYDAQGELVELVGYCLDIHAYKELEHDIASAEDIHALFVRREEQKLLAERKQVAQLLHDDVGQMLTALGLQTFAIQAQVLTAAEPVRQAVSRLADLVRETQLSLRRATALISPPYAGNGDLLPALQEMVRRVQGPNDLQITLSLRALANQTYRLNNAESLAVFRFVQEALTNAIRHGHASLIEVSAHYRHGMLSMQVSDNGQGFVVIKGVMFEGMGLSGIRERAKLIGAQFELASTPGEGTVVRLSFRPAPSSSGSPASHSEGHAS